MAEEKLFLHMTPHAMGVQPVYMTFDEFAEQVGPGWKVTLKDLVEKLRALGWGGGVDQVKEKFGTLRFYFENDVADPVFSDIAWDVVTVAERKTEYICETCGEFGKVRLGGWIKVRCDECQEKYEAESRK